MHRDFAKPVNAGRLEQNIRVEAACDGVTDNRLPLFGKQPDLFFFLTYNRVNLDSFAVEVAGSGLLLFEQG